MILIYSFFLISAVVFIYFIIKPTLDYKLYVGQEELILTRSLPLNKKLIIKPEEINDILIELIMDKPYAAIINNADSIRIKKLNQANYASLKEFSAEFNIKCIKEEIYHGG